MPATPTVLPAWKRERRAPLQGPRLPMTPETWKPGHSRTWARRGPLQKLIHLGFAAAITASIAWASAPTVHASDGCDTNSGPEGVTIGALSYVREVFDDAILKVEERKIQGDRQALGNIELDNDYLCDTPAVVQPVLRFMTESLLIYVMDVMHI